MSDTGRDAVEGLVHDFAQRIKERNDRITTLESVLTQAREALMYYDFKDNVPQEAFAAIDAVLSGAPVDTPGVEVSVDYDNDGDLVIDLHRGAEIITLAVGNTSVAWSWRGEGNGTAPIPDGDPSVDRFVIGMLQAEVGILKSKIRLLEAEKSAPVKEE